MAIEPLVDLRLLKRLPSGINRDEGSNVHKWLRVFSAGDRGLDYTDSLLDTIAASRHIDTATGGALEQFGAPVGCARETGQSDDDYRVSIKACYLKVSGKATRNEILGFVASAAGVDLTAVTFKENQDRSTGLYKSRYYYVDIDLAAFPAEVVGSESGLAALQLLIDGLLDDVEAAGVRGQFFASSTFSYEGDGSTAFGSTGQGTNATGWDNTAATPNFGGVNSGGTWGFFT